MSYFMSINLIEIAKSHLSDQVISKIASAVGLEPSSAGGIIGKVFPSLLGLFADKGSTGEGASQIFDLLKDQDTGFLDQLSDTFSGDQTSNMEKGVGLLAGLLSVVGEWEKNPRL